MCGLTSEKSTTKPVAKMGWIDANDINASRSQGISQIGCPGRGSVERDNSERCARLIATSDAIAATSWPVRLLRQTSQAC